MLELVDRSVPHEVACREAWTQLLRRRPAPPTVRLPEAVHCAIFSPSGGGKGRSIAIPWLLNCGHDGSVVLTDFKGELASITARNRERWFKRRSFLVDPFQLVTKHPDTLNVLDSISVDDPHALNHCADLASALVVRQPGEHQPHFNDSAEFWLTATIAAVVGHCEVPQLRSLQMVREILSDPQKIEKTIEMMCESELWDGMLARCGAQLRHYVDKERSSVLTTVTRHLRFLDTPTIAASTQTSSFQLSEILSGNVDIYLILPPSHMRALSGLLRLWISSCLRASIQGGLQETRKTHFLLDEAASLEHLVSIDDAIDKYRGYGVRLILMYQSIAQLKRCFPDGQDITLLANAIQIYFGANDMTLAEAVSSRIGESTIVVESGGHSRGWSRQATYNSAQPSDSAGSSGNSNTNWAQQARKLLKPEEVLQLPKRTAITFVPGMPPIMTTLSRYDEEKNLGRPAGPLRRFATATLTLGASLLLCLAMLGAAALLGHVLNVAGPGSLADMLIGC